MEACDERFENGLRCRLLISAQRVQLRRAVKRAPLKGDADSLQGMVVSTAVDHAHRDSFAAIVYLEGLGQDWRKDFLRLGTTMPLYVRFGISRKGVDPSVSLDVIQSCEIQIAKRTDDLGVDMRMLASALSGVAVRYYLLDDFDKAREYGSRVLPAVLEYFWGNWRTKARTDLGTIDPTWWHTTESWMSLFGSALLWGSVLRDWASLRDAARYPDDRSGLDTVDATPALRKLYIEIGKHLRGEAVEACAAQVGKLQGSTWHGTYVLARCLDAIAQRENRMFQKSIDEFFRCRHMRKSSNNVTDTISMEGTFMLNLAQHEGINTDIRPEYEIYYLRLPS